MSLYSTSGYRSFLLEASPSITNPYQRRHDKKADSQNHGWQYNSNYTLDSSWVSGQQTDPLRDSMLAYTKRMTEIKKIRGLQILKSHNLNNNNEQLWISVTGVPQKSSHEPRKSVKAIRVPPRSLGAIKLEPLLGSYDGKAREKRVQIEADVQKPTAFKSIRLAERYNESGTVSPKQIKLTIDLPTVENDSDPESPDEDSGSPAGKMEKITEPEEQKKEETRSREPDRKLILPPILNNGQRPRRAKRMKIQAPPLESIVESRPPTEPQTPVTVTKTEPHTSPIKPDQPSIHVHNASLYQVDDEMEKINKMRAQLLNLVKHEEERVREQMILKATYRYKRSDKESRRSKMSSLAHKKFSKLPPLPPKTKPVTLKYTVRVPHE